MSSEKNGLRSKIREKYDKAEFFSCKARKSNLIIKNTVRKNRFISELFEEISEIGTFLQKSSKNKKMLKRHGIKNTSKTIKTRWNYSSRILKDIDVVPRNGTR